jgi:hypothetical protein
MTKEETLEKWEKRKKELMQLSDRDPLYRKTSFKPEMTFLTPEQQAKLDAAIADPMVR